MNTRCANPRRAWPVLAVVALFTLGPVRINAQERTPDGKSRHAAAGQVDPKINAPFQKARVEEFIKRFESNEREVYVRRRDIVRALGLKSGMAVADLGAGTGLFTRLLADQVGAQGKVYAIDISKDFLDHISGQARSSGQLQIKTVRGSQSSTGLTAGSVDLVFLCDVYHHLEDHERILASIRQALRPGGTLVVVEFNRVKGKSTEFVLKHVRASQTQFRQEIAAAGFEPIVGHDVGLKENFMAYFRRP